MKGEQIYRGDLKVVKQSRLYSYPLQTIVEQKGPRFFWEDGNNRGTRSRSFALLQRNRAYQTGRLGP